MSVAGGGWQHGQEAQRSGGRAGKVAKWPCALAGGLGCWNDWQEAALFDLDQVKARELAKLDEIEHKAWLAWERSCTDIETMEITGSSQGGKGKPERVRKITKGQAGDSRFLTIILDCVKRRCEILGLDARRSLSIKGSVKAPSDCS